MLCVCMLKKIIKPQIVLSLMHTKLGTCLFIDNFLNAGLQNNVKLVAVELLAFWKLFFCCFCVVLCSDPEII